MFRPQRLFIALALAASVPVLSHAADLPGAVILTGTAEQFSAACKKDLDQARAEVARLKAMKAPRNTAAALRAYDNANLAINFASNRAQVAQVVHPDEAMRNAAEKCGQDASTVATAISLDRGVYDALAGLDVAKADKATKYLLKQSLDEFRRAGVDRDQATRDKIAALNDELTKIGQEFNKNVAKGSRSASFAPEELDGLPDDYKQAHAPGADGKVVLTTAYPDYLPFMKYARSSAARERFYLAYNQRAYPENIDVLRQLLTKRYELATLLGYKNWADYATENKMIGSGQNAADFIARISNAAGPRMQTDYQELLAQAKADNPAATEVHPWDSAYYGERLRSTKYQFDSQSMRPYFEYRKVKEGLFDIVSKMYGVQFRQVKDAKVWHPSVEVYDVYDGKKSLGRIYLDMFPRKDKYNHAANFFLTPGRAGTYLPEMILACNFSDPSKGPALMDHGDVTTFFHEFGHTMHLIFSGQPKYAGYNFQWDFIEAPSQMFEEWTVTPAILQLFAKHYQTGEVIPAEMVKRLRAAEEASKGLDVRRQMSFAALSLELHRADPATVDSDRMVQQVTEQYTPFHYVPNTHFQTAFTHLEGYSAAYYTYMWSLVIAKDILTEFQQNGLMNTTVAMKYRKDVLEPGASQPAADLITRFLGRPYSFDAYQRWLNQAE